MDSGVFLDVVSIILNKLDLKSLIQLSSTCHFWKQRIYNDSKLWPNIIELPFLGYMDGSNDRRNDPESIIQAKVWSMIFPPEDPKALEKVDFKNYIHTDESLRLTALLFPSITQISFEENLLTINGIDYITKSCPKLKHIEFYGCDHLNMAHVFRLFNTEEYKMNLERIFLHYDGFTSDRPFSTEYYLPFISLCQRCGLFFNQFKNDKQMLCLYHPGKYDGYGHSCSSYNCCGSNTPNYPSTLGCQYTYHKTIRQLPLINTFRIHELHNGHPEYMFKKYNYKMFSLRFTSRRRLDKCYHKWNIKEQEKE